MMPTTAKTELPIVPLFATYTKGRYLDNAPTQFGPSGDLAERLDRSRAIVMDDGGTLYEANVHIQPHVPTFCGGAIAVLPTCSRLATVGDPSLFPTVPSRYARAAAMVAAIALGQNEWRRYMVSLFGPVDYDYHIGKLVLYASPMFREHAPVVYTSEVAMRMKFAVGRRHKNPNSGNSCVNITLTSDSSRLRHTTPLLATNEQVSALYDEIAEREHDILPPVKRNPTKSTGEVKW